MHRSSLVVAVVLVALGCAHGAQDDPVGSSSARSEACLSFQKAYCDWDADKCHAHDRATCEDTANALYCTTDEKASTCSGALSSASCGGLPSACTGVVDTKPAIAECNALVDDYCTATERCGQSKKADCVTSTTGQLDCQTAVGASPTIDRCFADLGADDCASLALALPTSCTGVIKVSSPTPTPGARMHAPTSPFVVAVALP